jgi:hypothetical protein
LAAKKEKKMITLQKSDITALTVEQLAAMIKSFLQPIGIDWII